MAFIQFYDTEFDNNIGLMVSVYNCKPEIYIRAEDKDGGRIEISLSKTDVEQLHSYLGLFLKNVKNED
jgi:hypothetical protein